MVRSKEDCRLRTWDFLRMYINCVPGIAGAEEPRWVHIVGSRVWTRCRLPAFVVLRKGRRKGVEAEVLRG